MSVDEKRFEHTHADLPPGTICHTTYRGERQAYLFAGWRSNTAGRIAIFVRVGVGERANAGWVVHDVGFVYTATYTDTILKKFPDLPAELSHNCPVNPITD